MDGGRENDTVVCPKRKSDVPNLSQKERTEAQSNEKETVGNDIKNGNGELEGRRPTIKHNGTVKGDGGTRKEIEDKNNGGRRKRNKRRAR